MTTRRRVIESVLLYPMSLRLRLTGQDAEHTARLVPAVNVADFGALGNGRAFDDSAIENAVSAAMRAGGGDVVFPPTPSFYRVGNHQHLVLRDLVNIRLLGYGARIRNDTGDGATGEIVGIKGTVDNLTIEGLTFESGTESPTSYDNLLNIGDAAIPGGSNRDVRIRNCRFLGASNKLLAFEGPTRNVEIEGCTFERSNLNTNPMSNEVFGAISFYWGPGEMGRGPFQDIAIRGCRFAANSLFCVTMNQWQFQHGGHDFENIWIQGNVFRRSTGGLVVRARNVWIENNVFEGVGLGNITHTYGYSPVGAPGRFFSTARAGAGEVARTETTFTPARLPVIYVADSTAVAVAGNRFVGCVESQCAAKSEGGAPDVSVMEVTRVTGASIERNVVDERRSSASVCVSPVIRIGRNAEDSHGVTCDANLFLFDPQRPPTGPLIAIGSGNVVRGLKNEVVGADSTIMYERIR